MRLLILANSIVFYVALLAVKSTFSTAFGSTTTQALMALMALTLVVGCISALPYRTIPTQIAAAGMLFLFAVQMYMFHVNSGYATNWNMIFSLLPALSFVLFSHPRFDFHAFLRIAFWIALAYSALYCIFYATINQAPLDPIDDPTIRVLPSDGVRDTRVYLAGMFPAFALFYAVVVFRERLLVALMLSAVPIYALILAQSRLFGAVVAFTLLLHLAGLYSRKLCMVLACLYLATVAITLCAVTFDFNPMSLLAGDASGAARYYTFDRLQRLIGDSFIFGIGLASSRDDDALFLKDYSVFWSDTGTVGIWYAFGLAGVLVFTLQVFLLITGLENYRNWLSKKDHKVIMLTGLVGGLSSILSPGIWMADGALIVGMIFGLWLRGTFVGRGKRAGPLDIATRRAQTRTVRLVAVSRSAQHEAI